MSEARDARRAQEDVVRAALDESEVSDAVSHTLDLYGRELYRFLRGVLQDDASADDVYQNLCVEILRSLPAFAWRSSLRTWVYRLARHALARSRRDPGHRESPLLTRDEAALVTGWTRTATAQWRQTETKRRLWRATEELTEEDRTILVLRLLDGMSWRDIAGVLADDGAEAAALDSAAARLRKRFERIKAGLRDRLVPDGETNDP